MRLFRSCSQPVLFLVPPHAVYGCWRTPAPMRPKSHLSDSPAQHPRSSEVNVYRDEFPTSEFLSFTCFILWLLLQKMLRQKNIKEYLFNPKLTEEGEKGLAQLLILLLKFFKDTFQNLIEESLSLSLSL
jgi:hypothetical protein